MRTSVLLVMLVPLLLTSCSAAQCGRGTVLRDGYCEIDLVDAGATDAGVADAGRDDAGTVSDRPDASVGAPCRVLLDDGCDGALAIHCRSTPDGGLSGGAISLEDCSLFGGTCTSMLNVTTCTGGLYGQRCTQTTCASKTFLLQCAADGTHPLTCGEGNSCFTTANGTAECLPSDTQACDRATFHAECAPDAGGIRYCATSGYVEFDRCSNNWVCDHNTKGAPVCIAAFALPCDAKVRLSRCLSASTLGYCDSSTDHETPVPCSAGCQALSDGGASCQ